jgi:LytTr DNA-binding domain
MLYILNKPYPFLAISFQTKLAKAIATGLFVIFFLWLFDNKEQNSILLFVDNGIVVFVSQLLLLFILHRLFARQYFNSTIRLWQYMAGLAAGVLLGFTLMYLYVTPVYFKIGYSFGAYIDYIRENLPFLFPVILFMVAVDYIFVLKTRLRLEPGLAVTDSIETSMSIGNTIIQQEFVLYNESGVAIFTASKASILYIKSADNYIEIYYQSGNQLKKELVRYSLGAVEADKETSFIVRVHRSYLCNLEKAESLSGGIQNCMLHFCNGQGLVPVARSRARDIMQIVNSQRPEASQSPH